ncbi:GNAT family N-acetyltransferase [Actinotalea sp. C106]|uniref:GNAT family N-acetyltransferase n=1 Tax=Actinotalea sp. C106 TaxID=2908644 RepID=UPI00202805E1|nr:GNAT family N-acetyltransferase [Actinotalea sp. C106]
MSTLPAGYRAVDVPESRRDHLLEVDTWAFPGALTDEQVRALPVPLAWDRTRGVEAPDGELVAIHASYPFSRFPVPGARIPVAGLTWVGVHPGHRRRGLLRAMITEHVTRSLARGEAVSALFAAEAPIYGRFGYGLAARDLRLTIPRGAALRDVPGAEDVRVRVERLDPSRHGALLHEVHGTSDRPGWATRETEALRESYLADPEPLRDGAESVRVLLAERDGRTVGYALFRRRSAWEVPGPRGTVRVREVVAPDAAVARALWGVLLDLDLTATVETGMLAPDDAITHLLVDLRGAEPRTADNLWVRVLDVPSALAARRYAAPVDVVLDVTDTLVEGNTGRWHLHGGPDGAQVGRTEAAAHLSLDVRELGAAYLGGSSLTSLAGAGLVTELEPGALAPAATAFGWPEAPVCSWVF